MSTLTSREECGLVALCLLTQMLDPTASTWADLSLLAHGRLDLVKIPTNLLDAIGRFLGGRPNSFTSARGLRLVLEAASKSGKPAYVSVNGNTWHMTTTVDRVELLEAMLRKLGNTANRTCPTPPDSYPATLLHRLRDTPEHTQVEYRVPFGGRTVPALELHVTPAQPMHTPLGRLRALAQRISKSPHARPYQQVVLDDLLAQASAASDVERALPGPTQLLVAPTGRGKSLWMDLVALDQVGQGHPVGMVLPLVHDLWKTKARLESLAQAAGLTLTVAVLSGVMDQRLRLQQWAKAKPDRAEEALKAAGYSCWLTAYTEGSTPQPSRPPCNSLRSTTGRAMRCPFDLECGLHQGVVDLPQADVVLINAHALLSGRARVPITIHGQVKARAPYLELVLARCPIVLIDEVDSVQEILFSNFGRELTLHGRKSPLANLAESLRRRRAQQPAIAELAQQARAAVLQLMNDSHELAFWVGDPAADIDWNSRFDKRLAPDWRWTWKFDKSLATRLFPIEDQDVHFLRRLFDMEITANSAQAASADELSSGALPRTERSAVPDIPSSRPELFLALQRVLREHRIRGHQGDSTLRDLRDDLLSCMTTHEVKDRAKCAAQLAIRNTLLRLDSHLGHLQRWLPALVSEFDAANSVLDGLASTSVWTPSPCGALGRPLRGYKATGIGDSPDEPSLSVTTMAGDAHTFIRSLGSEVARAVVGTTRVVIGLSATAQFPDAVTSHVHAPVWASVPDDLGRVRVRGVPDLARVSGVQGADRARALRGNALIVWDRFLRPFVKKKNGVMGSHMLVVTPSYREAQIVAEQLRQHADTDVYLLVRPGQSSGRAWCIERPDLASFSAKSAGSILVGPLAPVARGHNIVHEGGKSAVGLIVLMVRPVLPADDPGRVLAYIHDRARRGAERRGPLGDRVMAERRIAFKALDLVTLGLKQFTALPNDVRRAVLADVLVSVVQLVGRARRGGTDADLVLADAAFDDPKVGWPELVDGLISRCDDPTYLLHKNVLDALARYAANPGSES